MSSTKRFDTLKFKFFAQNVEKKGEKFKSVEGVFCRSRASAQPAIQGLRGGVWHFLCFWLCLRDGWPAADQWQGKSGWGRALVAREFFQRPVCSHSPLVIMPRARIHRCFKDAEKIPFHEKISFQRSGSTAGLPAVFLWSC